MVPGPLSSRLGCALSLTLTHTHTEANVSPRREKGRFRSSEAEEEEEGGDAERGGGRSSRGYSKIKQPHCRKWRECIMTSQQLIPAINCRRLRPCGCFFGKEDLKHACAFHDPARSFFHALFTFIGHTLKSHPNIRRGRRHNKNHSKVIKGDGHQSQSLAQDPGAWDSASAGGERDSPGLVWDIMSWLHLGSLGGWSISLWRQTHQMCPHYGGADPHRCTALQPPSTTTQLIPNQAHRPLVDLYRLYKARFVQCILFSLWCAVQTKRGKINHVT